MSRYFVVLALLASYNYGEASLIWSSVDSREAKEISRCIFSSGLLESTVPENSITPLEQHVISPSKVSPVDPIHLASNFLSVEHYRSPDGTTQLKISHVAPSSVPISLEGGRADDNLIHSGEDPTRLIISKYEKNDKIHLFFVAIILKNVVAIGQIHTVEAEALDTVWIQTEAERYKLRTVTLAMKWEKPEHEDNFKTFVWPKPSGFSFRLELSFEGSNGQIVGLLSTPNSALFCFAVLEMVNNQSLVSYMGFHHKDLSKAFVDLEKYATHWKALIIDEWLNEIQISNEPTKNVYRNLLNLKALVIEKLGWADNYFRVEYVKTVSTGKKGLIVIYKTSSNHHITVAAIERTCIPSPMRGLPSSMEICYVGQEIPDQDIAKREIEHVHTLVFSDKLSRQQDEWVWAYEIYNLNQWARIKPLDEGNLENCKKEIQTNSLFPISEGESVYLLKLRKYAERDQWIGIYGYSGKLFIVAFKVKPVFAITFCGALGTDEEVHDSYEALLQLFPNCSHFELGMGSVTALFGINDEYLKALVVYVTMVLRIHLDGTLVYTPNLSKIIPAPFDHIKKVEVPYFYAVAFQVNGTGDKMLYLIVETTTSGVLQVHPKHPSCVSSTHAGAIGKLVEHFRSEHLTSLISVQFSQ